MWCVTSIAKTKGGSCIPALVFCGLPRASAWANLSSRTTLFLEEIWCKGSFSGLFYWTVGPWQPVHNWCSTVWVIFPFFICLENPELLQPPLFLCSLGSHNDSLRTQGQHFQRKVLTMHQWQTDCFLFRRRSHFLHECWTGCRDQQAMPVHLPLWDYLWGTSWNIS